MLVAPIECAYAIWAWNWLVRVVSPTSIRHP
jgi:hypothetical protein